MSGKAKLDALVDTESVFEGRNVCDWSWEQGWLFPLFNLGFTGFLACEVVLSDRGGRSLAAYGEGVRLGLTLDTEVGLLRE